MNKSYKDIAKNFVDGIRANIYDGKVCLSEKDLDSLETCIELLLLRKFAEGRDAIITTIQKPLEKDDSNMRTCECGSYSCRGGH